MGIPHKQIPSGADHLSNFTAPLRRQFSMIFTIINNHTRIDFDLISLVHHLTCMTIAFHLVLQLLSRLLILLLLIRVITSCTVAHIACNEALTFLSFQLQEGGSSVRNLQV